VNASGRGARLAAVVAMIAGAHQGCSRASLHAVTGGPSDGAADGGAGDAGPADAGPADAGVTTDGSAASAGCQKDPLLPGDTNRIVQVGTVARSYVLHVPPSFDGTRPAPLVVDFHGVGQTGASERMMSPYPAALDPAGVVMAFPDGLKGTAGTGWDVGPCCVANADDVGFARALVMDAAAAVCLDLHRVYAVGVLTGGGMAHFVACHAADIFAAVAPAAFDLLAENVDECLPDRGITVISFRGTADPRVPYEGGPSSAIPGMPLTFLGAEGTFEKWAAIDGCAGQPSAPDANGCARYGTCRDGAEVILCTKRDGGDDPGDPAIAWPVLMRHTR